MSFKSEMSDERNKNRTKVRKDNAKKKQEEVKTLRVNVHELTNEK